ncbi:MAG: FtsW/RodA/SpoVE family cell cycle protein [Pseudomonadota bacterium]|nr:FtsW/RodA/SpoVE family cell cycle protein [Pseudomonadota bacterium]
MTHLRLSRWLLPAATLLVALLLYQAAQPLSGMKPIIGPLPRYPGHGDLRDLQALAQLQGIGLWLAVWSALGAIQLELARRLRPGFAALLWLATFAALAAAPAGLHGVSGESWLLAAASTGVLAALLTGFGRTTGLRALPGANMPLAWPGFMLFAGLGVLLITDIAAAGPPELRYVGLQQLENLWLAGLVLLPLVCLLRESLMRWLAACAALAERRPRLAFLSLLVLSLALGGLIAWQESQKQHSASEVARFLLMLAWSWLLYRHGERWHGRRQRRLLAWLALPLLLVLTLGTYALGGDFGPILIIAWTLLILTAAAIPRAGGAALILAAGIACLHWGLTQWLPQQPWAEHVRIREATRTQPQQGPRVFLSQHAWLKRAAPSGGWGLGAAPWCGARAALGAGDCTAHSGVSEQFTSDYIWVGLVAVHGRAGALFLLGLLLLHTWAVSRAATPRQPAQAGDRADLARLQAWVLAVQAAHITAQTLVSLSGNEAWLPLTGVTLPYFSLGGTSLALLAVWIGLAAVRLPASETSRRPS